MIYIKLIDMINNHSERFTSHLWTRIIKMKHNSLTSPWLGSKSLHFFRHMCVLFCVLSFCSCFLQHLCRSVPQGIPGTGSAVVMPDAERCFIGFSFPVLFILIICLLLLNNTLGIQDSTVVAKHNMKRMSMLFMARCSRSRN